jgi:hypothetical protein
MRRKRAPIGRNAHSGNGLAGSWRQEARLARELGATEAAQTLERCAGQLEVVEREHALEALTLEQAAAASGYSYSTLQHLVADGRIKNAGSDGRPRIRRADLPRKPGVQTSGKLGLAERVLAARHRKGAA